MTIKCHICYCVSLVTTLYINVAELRQSESMCRRADEDGGQGVDQHCRRWGDNKVVTRKLLFWDAARMMAGCEIFWEEALSMCACFALSVQTWKCGALV